jgi:hypothetical protein
MILPVSQPLSQPVSKPLSQRKKIADELAEFSKEEIVVAEEVERVLAPPPPPVRRNLSVLYLQAYFQLIIIIAI